MRTRTYDQRSFLTGISHWTYYKQNGSLCKENDYPSDWVNGTVSHMIDAGTKKTDEIRTRYLEVSRTEVESFPINVVNSFHASDCGGMTTYTVKGRLGPGYSIQGSPWILDDSAIQSAIRSAFRYFEAGCVDQETLLANFAWELPDVRNLWPAFRDFFKKRKGGTLTGIGKKTKDGANAYLAYNFGVIPLVGDLMNIYTFLLTLDDHIKWLRKTSGQKTRVEYRQSLPKPTANNLPSRPTSVPSGGGGFWRQYPEIRAGFKAWALLTYDVSALTDVQLKTKSLIRAFGLNNPAAVIWEAIPYSFVIDWVSNFGKLVDMLEKPIRLPVVFHDSGYGVFCDSIIEDMYTTWGKTTMIRRTRCRGYSRRPGLPISISSLSLETPTAKQLVLGLALSVQKF